MRSTSTLLTVAIALLAEAAPGVAHASPGYPADIKTDLGLTYNLGVSHCTICHRDNAGGLMTVIRPFGLAMMGQGLVSERPDLLQAALKALGNMQTDSDCDGVDDITQLKNGRDPNPPGEYIDGSGKMWTKSDPGCPDTITYGCGARLARGPAGWEGALAILTGVAFASVMRARRTRRTRRKRSRLSYC
jgi:hypothetical protein